MRQSSMTLPILIVDDEPNVLKEMPKAFSQSWPESYVHIAHSFPVALELLKVNNYGIVLLDGGLSARMTDPPEHGLGFNLIPTIRSTCPKAIVIMISGDEKYCSIGLKMGANYAFPKNLFFKDGKVFNSLKVDEANNFSIREGL